MPPVSQNPLVIAAYVAGLLLSVPVLVALVKAIFFFARITSTLQDVVEKLNALITEMREYRDLKNNQLQDMELRLALVEKDVDGLKQAAKQTIITPTAARQP